MFLLLRLRGTIRRWVLRGDSNSMNKKYQNNMKKIAFLVSLAFVTLSVVAQDPVITSTSSIILDGQTDVLQVNFAISDSWSDGFDNTWDAVNSNPGTGIYVVVNDDEYTTWASNKYSTNLALGFVAAATGSHKLQFANFSGVSYKIYDREEGKTIEVLGNNSIKIDGEAATEYAFTAAAGAHNNRFVINYNANELDVCFIDNVLQISSNPYDNPIIISSPNGKKEVAVAPTPQNISLNDSTAGNYTVEFGPVVNAETGAHQRKFVVVVKH